MRFLYIFSSFWEPFLKDLLTAFFPFLHIAGGIIEEFVDLTVVEVRTSRIELLDLLQYIHVGEIRVGKLEVRLAPTAVFNLAFVRECRDPRVYVFG